MSIFGETLRKLRHEHKLTQSQLGQAIGVSYSTISMYERGEREPDFETTEAIADYFNVSMDSLLGTSSKSRTFNMQTIIDNSHSVASREENVNTIKIAGRDGSYIERTLTDDQLDLIKKMIDQLPNAEDL